MHGSVPDGKKAPVVTSLPALSSGENTCRRCLLYKHATQAVPGQGPRTASMMLVGEQPGDQEDRACPLSDRPAACGTARLRMPE
jgi:uracil-DNA glycosylase